jgi:uncharacterized membrane protein HdeD (DUF308 family)
LGIAAIFIGAPLVCGGIFGIIGGVAMSHSEPEFGGGLVQLGMLATLFGSLLCYAAWWRSKHDGKE